MQKKKSFWKRGVAEILGFGCALPFMILVICAIFSATQISLASEQLLYAAYSAGRAAVVTATEADGRNRTEEIIEAMYSDMNCIVDFLPSETNTKAKAEKLGKNDIYCVIEYVNKGSDWYKGSIIRCTVYQYISPLMPFTAGVRSQSLVMMVENGLGS